MNSAPKKACRAYFLRATLLPCQPKNGGLAGHAWLLNLATILLLVDGAATDIIEIGWGMRSSRQPAG